MTNWSAAKEHFPELDETTDPKFWFMLFVNRPDALHALLYDIYAITKAQEQGKGKGRRVRNIDGNLEELWSMIL